MYKVKPLPPLAYLEQLLTYNAHTGKFHWLHRSEELFKTEHSCKAWNTRRAGTQAGYVTKDGYVCIRVDEKQYLGHRLAYYMSTGVDPLELTIDHVNHNRADNRFCNIRLATVTEQQRNRSESSNNISGVTGVHWNKKGNKHCSQIYLGGKRKHLGTFEKFEDAVKARKKAERELGYHENHGNINLNLGE